MARIVSLFRNRNFIFSLAVISGITCSYGARFSRHIVLPVLAIVMTVSVIGVPTEFFKLNRSMFKPVIIGLIMSFIIKAGSILGLGWFIISDDMLWKGIVLVASVPPAVATIPFTALLGGNTEFSLMATIGSYLLGLVITPLICLIFIGASIINPAKILIILVELVIAPIVGSRILVFLGLDKPVLPYKGIITNWGFFVVIYTVMGLNQKIFFSNPGFILPLIFIFFLTTFLLGFVIELTARVFKINPEIAVSINLLGTLKNAGTSAGIALILFNETVALPASIYTFFMIMYFIWFDIKRKWIS